jgi:hypothetical protein
MLSWRCPSAVTLTFHFSGCGTILLRAHPSKRKDEFLQTADAYLTVFLFQIAEDRHESENPNIDEAAAAQFGLAAECSSICH